MSTVGLLCKMHLSHCSIITIIILSIATTKCHSNPAIATVPLMAQSGGPHPRTHSQQTAGCWFGENEFYGLEETWHPVLEPMGEMVCIVCKCNPVFRKGRLAQQGNVDCQNIAPTCPVVECPDAELLPGECCKRCPREAANSKPEQPLLGGGFGLGGMGDSGMAMGDEGGKGQEEFLALLVGRARRTRERTRATATGRFTLVEQDLTFALHITKMDSPRAIWFVEEHGTLLHEIVLKRRELRADRNTMYKVCGTWSDIPSIYTRYLQTGKLHVVITSSAHARGEISGQVYAHRALQKETWTSVMAPGKRDGSGAVVIMRYEQPHTLSFLIIHSGISAKKQLVNASIVFGRKQRSMARFNVDIKPQETETTGVWSRPTKSALKSLVRGRIQVSVEVNKKTTLRGEITPRLTCNEIHAILTTSSDTTTKNQHQLQPISNGVSSNTYPKNAYKTDNKRRSKNRLRQGIGGAISFTVTPKGKLNYGLKLSGLTEAVEKIEVFGSSPSPVRSKPICVVQRQPIKETGSCGSIQAEQIQGLYHTQITAVVTTRDRQQPVISGSLRPVVYNQPSFRSGKSVVLSGSGIHPPVVTSLVSHTWLSVSDECHLHFTVTLDGFGNEPDISWTPYTMDRLNGHTYSSSLFTGRTAKGSIEGLPAEFFRRLSVGLVVFGISTTRNPNGELSSNVTLSSSCRDGLPSRENPLDENPLNDGSVLNEDMANLPNTDELLDINQCNDNGIIYDDGQTFIPLADACSTCSCSRGQTLCQEVVCPAVMCLNPIDVPGDCCPHCPPPSSSFDYQLPQDECYFDGDKRMHRYGTVFHPYVMPFGYQKCAVCSCSSGDNEVVCAQLPCPDLPCPQEDAVRLKPDDCCQVCPDGATANVQNEQAAVDDNPFTNILNMQTSCSYRGKMYVDGSDWHPRLASFGTDENCVKCQCQAGKVTCSREICEELSCDVARQVKEVGACCPKCL